MRLNPAFTEIRTTPSGRVDFLGVPHLKEYSFPIEHMKKFEEVGERIGLTPYQLLKEIMVTSAYTGYYFLQDYRNGEWFLNRVKLPRIYSKGERKIRYERCHSIRGVDPRVCSNLRRLHRMAGFTGFPHHLYVQVRGVVFTEVIPQNKQWFLEGNRIA